MVLGLKPMGKLATSKKKKKQVQDRTEILHGPRTKSFGETSYFQKKQSTRQNQGLAWSSESNLWGNYLLPEKNKVVNRSKVLHGPRTQTYGELATSKIIIIIK